MVWFLPIGTYDGPSNPVGTAQAVGEPSGPDVTLRTGTGTVTVPLEYGYVLDFLATAPLDVRLHEWVSEQDDSQQASDDFDELIENGFVMTFGEFPLSDPRMANRIVIKRADPAPVDSAPTGTEDDYLKLVDAGNGKVLANEWLVDLVTYMDDLPIDLQDLYRKFEQLVPEAEQRFADQLFESGLKSLVRTGAIGIVVKE